MDMKAAHAHVDWGSISGLVMKDLSTIGALIKDDASCVTAMKSNDPVTWLTPAQDACAQVSKLWADYKALGLPADPAHASMMAHAIEAQCGAAGPHIFGLPPGTLVGIVTTFLGSPTGQSVQQWLLGLLGKVLSGGIGGILNPPAAPKP